jgi:hypothetical protein
MTPWTFADMDAPGLLLFDEVDGLAVVAVFEPASPTETLLLEYTVFPAWLLLLLALSAVPALLPV